MTLTDVERLAARAGETDETFLMDEDAFRAFYERTARPLWAYLSRITGDRQLCDDLLQEAYYRFLRARRFPKARRIAATISFALRRTWCATRIAAARSMRCRSSIPVTLPTPPPTRPARVQRRTDLARGLSQLKPRERDLLWLAYAQGSSHREIADTLGLAPGSIKLLLYRARQRLATFLRGDVTGSAVTREAPSADRRSDGGAA